MFFLDFSGVYGFRLGSGSQNGKALLECVAYHSFSIPFIVRMLVTETIGMEVNHGQARFLVDA